MEKELSRVPRLLSESYNSGLVERLYDSGGSVMLDIIIYLCGNHIRDLFGESWFSIEDFCNKMGYNRTNLQRKLSKEQLKDLFGKRSPHYICKDINGEEISHPIETVFEAALYKLGLENMSYPVSTNEGTSYIFIQILTKFEIRTNFKTKKGTKRLYSATLNNLIKDSVYTLYNLIESQDYRELPSKYRYFYLELSKMIYLIKYKIKTGDAPSYRLTVDQLAKLFNLNFEENKERKRNVTKVLKGINEHLRFTNFQFKYVKGANDKWAYTVDFEFSQETLDYFDERYTAMFTQRFYSDLLWRYAGLAFPNCAVGRDRVNKVEDIKSDRNLYEDYLAWANSPQNKALKKEVYRENFFRVFGKNPEEFGLTSNAPTVTREPKEFIVKNPPTVTPEPEKII